jgi:CheY-like chemotaxis protein
MLQSSLDLIRNAKTPFQILERANNLVPDVQDALKRVDQLIDDIIAISRREPLKLQSHKLESIIGEVASDVLRQFPDCNAGYSFSLKHTRQIEIEGNKVARVISNIITNAFQAMGNQGIVSISTIDQFQGGRDKVEISIHNSGPPISLDDIPFVFDSFFTKAKQGGTGLGLAIAKTFIEAHGGSINCESSEKHGTRFTFSLHAVGDSYSPSVPDINKVTDDIDRKTVSSSKSIGIEAKKNAFGKKQFHILIVEDEEVFQQVVLDEIERFTLDGYEISATVAQNSEAAQNSFATRQPDLIILDIDLGPLSSDGLDFLKVIRAKENNTFVCIHSNRTFFDSKSTLVDSGADLALPKPMSAENLTLMISEALKKGSSHKEKPRVVVVDDEACYLTAWQETMNDAEVIGFLDPEIFWDEIIEKHHVLQSISCFIFDFYFPGTDIDKLQLVESLRSKGFFGPIILSTNAPYDNTHASPKSRFDYVMKKNAMSYSALKAIPEVASVFHNFVKK